MKKFKAIKFDLEYALERRGISKYALAKAMDKDTSNIFRLCREDANPRLSTLIELAEKIDCPIEELFRKS